MSIRVKSVILLGCTLIVGIMIGILGTSTWQHRRNTTLAETRIQGGLMRHIEQFIEFEDEEQREEVIAVIRRAEQAFLQQRKHMADSIAIHRQTLLADLKKILNPDQWQYLEARLDRERKRQMRRRGRKERHPERRTNRKDSSNHRSKN